MLEGLQSCAVVCRLSGEVVYETFALQAMLGEGEAVRAFRTHVQALIEAVAPALAGEHPDPVEPLKPVEMGERTYYLNACLYQVPQMKEPCLVVGVRPEARVPPKPEDIRAAFDLTRRQSEVAALLAQRYTNAEIAEAFCISPHTVRRHTEAVLSKLGVDDRRLVETVFLDR